MTKPLPEMTTISRNDFAVGWFMGLSLRGIKAIDVTDIRAFHRAVEIAFKEMDENLDKNRFTMQFLVIRNVFHETSQDVTGMLSYLKSIQYLVARDLFEPNFLRMVPVRHPRAYIERSVPGEPETYFKVADSMMANFQGFRA